MQPVTLPRNQLELSKSKRPEEGLQEADVPRAGISGDLLLFVDVAFLGRFLIELKKSFARDT